MSVLSLIEKIAGRQKERQQQKVQSYRDLAKQIAGGNEPDPNTVETTLEAAGKSLDDLQQAVKLYEQRMTWKAQVALMPLLEKDRERINREIAAADKALEDAEALHSEVTGPLYGELHQIKGGVSEASTASSQLFHTCDNADLKRQLDALNQEDVRLSEARYQLRTHERHCETFAENRSLLIDRETNEVTRESRREQVKSLLKEGEDTRQKIRANERSSAELNKRREQIEQQMRIW